ncbi:hypothetical protein V5O48_009881 [Marasmius crinis-equi]|uniref:Rad60/SUMO-like domain-containing protein n=1 Tax=Marasmius crinis-equi TaxID=585013 RepID=A0ABR3F9Z9_9AGAR
MASYEDMRRIVRRKFDIDEAADMSFEVNNFAICNGQQLEVDESAYGAMAPYLDEIHVNVIQRDVGSSSSTAKGKGKETYPIPTPSNSDQSMSSDSRRENPQPKDSRPPSRTLSPAPNISPKPQAEPELPADGYPEDDEIDEEEERVLEQQLQPRVKSPSPPRLDVKKSKPPIATSTPLPDARSNVGSPAPLPPISPFKSPASPSTSRSNANDKGKTKSPVASGSGSSTRLADQLFNDSVTVEAEAVLSDPPAYSEAEAEPEPEPEVQDFRFGTQFFDKKKERKQPPADADIIEIDADEDEGQRPGPSSRTNSKKRADGTTVEGGERKSLSRPQPRRIVPKGKMGDDDGESSSALKPPRSKSKATMSRHGSNTEDAELPSGTQGPLLRDAPGDEEESLVQPDGRFKIFITGPKKTHRAEFMTKERHKIKKVLMGACKTFSLDPEKSRLESLLVTEDWGETEEHYFQCNNDDTVGKAGLRPGSQLRVVVEDIDELDDEPSSD